MLRYWKQCRPVYINKVSLHCNKDREISERQNSWHLTAVIGVGWCVASLLILEDHAMFSFVAWFDSSGLGQIQECLLIIALDGSRVYITTSNLCPLMASSLQNLADLCKGHHPNDWGGDAWDKLFLWNPNCAGNKELSPCYIFAQPVNILGLHLETPMILQSHMGVNCIISIFACTGAVQ